MDVLKTVLPVLVMLLLGLCCKRLRLLTRDGVESIKAFVTKIVLPVAIFHSLGTASYTATTAILVAIMLVMLAVSFGLGFLMRPLVPQPYGKYVPFMVSVYEGGMMAYPLYSNLCGAENLSQIAIPDIAGLLFGFSIYMGLLGQVEDKTPISAKKLALTALKSPAFLAAVLGIVCGLSGVLNALVAAPAGDTYLAVKNMITSPLNAMILLVVGYDMELNMSLIRPCAKTILLRVVLQAAMLLCVLTAIHALIGTNRLIDLAVICYMSAPATFSMQSYLKNEEASAYASTTNSLYCLVTIAVYMVLAAVGA